MTGAFCVTAGILGGKETMGFVFTLLLSGWEKDEFEMRGIVKKVLAVSGWELSIFWFTRSMTEFEMLGMLHRGGGEDSVMEASGGTEVLFERFAMGVLGTDD
jgi:hypothetical protein